MFRMKFMNFLKSRFVMMSPFNTNTGLSGFGRINDNAPVALNIFFPLNILCLH